MVQALGRLSRRNRSRFYAGTAAQAALSFLDLVAVVMLALVSGVAASIASSTPVTAQTPFGILTSAMVTNTELLLVNAVGAGLLLVLRSGVSVLINRTILRFLAKQQQRISRELIEKLTQLPPCITTSRRPQDAAYARVQGANAATLTVLAQVTVIASELSLLLLLGTGLFLIDPPATLMIGALLGLAAFLL